MARIFVTNLEENVVKASAEVGSVDRVVPRAFWIVYIFALGAVEFDVTSVWDVMLAHRE